MFRVTNLTTMESSQAENNMASSSTSPDNDEYVNNVKSLRTLQHTPVAFVRRSIPPHCRLSSFVAQLVTACISCLSSITRINSPLCLFSCKKVQDTKLGTDCLCADLPPSSLPPELTGHRREFSHFLSYKTLFELMPPCFPVLEDATNEGLSGKGIVPGEKFFLPQNSIPPPTMTFGHDILVCLRLLILSEPVMNSAYYYCVLQSMLLFEYTYNAMVFILQDEGVANDDQLATRQHIIQHLSSHIVSSQRVLRDVILQTDFILEQARKSCPSNWWNSVVFHCQSTKPIEATAHQVLLGILTLLRNITLSIQVLQFPRRASPEEMKGLQGVVPDANFETDFDDSNTYARIMGKLLSMAHGVSHHIVRLAIFSLRRYYLASWCLHSYKLALNHQLNALGYAWHRRQNSLTFEFGSLCSSTEGVQANPPDMPSRHSRALFEVRQQWSFPNVSTICFEQIRRGSLDTFRNIRHHDNFYDTCSFSCTESCTCLNMDHEETDELPSEFPEDWPLLRLNLIHYPTTSLPTQLDGSLAADPNPTPTPTPSTTLSYSPSSPSDDENGEDFSSRDDLPNPRHFDRRRRPLRDITNIFFLVLLLSLAGFSVGSVVVRQNFAFQTMKNDIIVNPNTRVYTRQVDFSTINHSIYLMRRIAKSYDFVCDLASKDSFRPSYYTLYSKARPSDPSNLCLAHELSSPQLDYPEEAAELYKHMVKEKINIALSPYFSHGPGSLPLNLYLKRGNTTFPAQPSLAVEPHQTIYNADFASLYVLQNNSVRLFIIDNLTNAQLNIPNSVFNTHHAVVCKYRPLVTNATSSAQDALQNLCKTDHRNFRIQIMRIKRKFKLILPKHINQLMRSVPSSTSAPANLKLFQPPVNLESIKEEQQSINQTALVQALVSTARRRRRAIIVGAAIALGAGLALMVANLALGTVNAVRIHNLENKLTKLSSDVEKLATITSELKENVLAIANKQKEDAENFQKKMQDVTVVLHLLTLRDDFSFLAHTAKSGIENFLNMVTLAHHNKHTNYSSPMTFSRISSYVPTNAFRLTDDTLKLIWCGRKLNFLPCCTFLS